MKLRFLLFLVVIVFSGCTQEKVVVGPSQVVVAAGEVTEESEDVTEEEVSSPILGEISDVAVEFVEDHIPTLDVGGPDDQNQDIPSVDLFMEDRLVNWGFDTQERGDGAVDTVIIHSAFNSKEGERYDVDTVVADMEAYGTAVHYVIDREGTVFRLVRERNTAFHAGQAQTPDGRTDVDAFSLGVLLIGSLDDNFTIDQYASLRALLTDIGERYTLKYVLGHDEVEVHAPWNFEWSRINDLRHEER